VTPPYRMIDQATGETATGPNGEVWEYMDVPAGHKMELYDTTATDGSPWTRVSPSEIVRPGGDTPPDPPDPPDPGPDPGPDPTPPTGAGMDYPKDENELAILLQSYATQQVVGMLDSRTRIEVTRPIVLQVPNTGRPWGVDGNYAQLTYRGSGDDLLRIEGAAGVNNRGLTLKNLVLDGGDGGNMSGGGASACLRVSAPLGDNGPIYKFHLENLYTSGAVNGVVLEGGVYEGEMKNIHVENCTGDGVVLRHMEQTPDGKAPVVSNVLIFHLNSSRNYGAGLRSVYSVNLIGGSFILNGGGGVVADDGLRYAAACNGENTGESVFRLGSNGYGSVISGGGEASSDGMTVCRRWDGSQWHDVGKPLLYFVDAPADVTVDEAHVSYYGGGSNPMRVRK